MNKQTASASTMAVWIVIGVAIGIATHQLALWIAIGVALGAAMAGGTCRKAKDNDAPGPQ